MELGHDDVDDLGQEAEVDHHGDDAGDAVDPVVGGLVGPATFKKSRENVKWVPLYEEKSSPLRPVVRLLRRESPVDGVYHYQYPRDSPSQPAEALEDAVLGDERDHEDHKKVDAFRKIERNVKIPTHNTHNFTFPYPRRASRSTCRP